MTISVTPRIKPKPNYYIYFNDWTGEIISVGCNPRSDSLAPFIVTDDKNAYRILRGQAAGTNYVIDNDQLVAKNEYLRLRNKEDKLSIIPQIKIKEWDIRVRHYTKNHYLTFEVNKDMVHKLIKRNMQNEILLNEKIDFKFYVIKNNNPDYLLKTITIDAMELINSNCFAAPMDDIIRHITASKVSVLTRRQFKNYYFESFDEDYVKPKEIDDHRWSHKIQCVTDDADSHVSLIQDGKYVDIVSLVSAEQLTSAGLYYRYLPLYFTGKTTDHYISKHIIDVNKLRMGNKERIAVDFDIMDVNILYQNPALKLNKRNVNDTHSN